MNNNIETQTNVSINSTAIIEGNTNEIVIHNYMKQILGDNYEVIKGNYGSNLELNGLIHDLSSIHGIGKGIIADTLIYNKTTKTTVIVEIKLQTKGSGNQHERACKYFTAPMIEKLTSIFGTKENPSFFLGVGSRYTIGNTPLELDTLFGDNWATIDINPVLLSTKVYTDSDLDGLRDLLLNKIVPYLNQENTRKWYEYTGTKSDRVFSPAPSPDDIIGYAQSHDLFRLSDISHKFDCKPQSARNKLQRLYRTGILSFDDSKKLYQLKK